MVSKWIGNLKERPEDECRKMQEAFDHFHTSKEWGMICMIHEVDGCLDIIIRDEQKPGLRCLCGVCWNKTYLTSEQLAWIQEKMCELKQKNSANPFSPSKASCSGKHTYNWGCIDSWKCRMERFPPHHRRRRNAYCVGRVVAREASRFFTVICGVAGC